VATWRVTYRPDRAGPRVWLIHDVEADEVYNDGRFVTLQGGRLVMDQPRQVTALRGDRRELAGRPFRLCDVPARWGGVRL
jgi:hypothetical protein